MSSSSIDSLIKQRKPGYALDQAFYRDPEIFQRDMDRVITRHWLAVDHESRIPNAGDFFLFELAGESIILVRGKDQEVRALFNVCRHRGSRVCLEKSGSAKGFVCPYHAWSYRLDGSLRGAAYMPEDFDAASHGLQPCHCRVLEGVIFVKLTPEDPGDFEEEMGIFRPLLQLHGIKDAKIAYRQTYPTVANWKLTVENFFECYHCAPAHPEYASVHSRAKFLAYGAGPGSGPEEAEAAFKEEMKAWEAKTTALGYPTGFFVDEPNQAYCRSYDRVPIRNGFLTETQDGKPVAPLMGKFKEYDGGNSSISFNPFATMLMNNDFATLFRFTPLGPTESEMELLWLVDGKAEEGVDYDVERIKWMWDVTTIADKTIIQNNHKGVMSSRYLPGPYSKMELAVERLVDWYLGQVG